jgi:hypothetical protein
MSFGLRILANDQGATIDSTIGVEAFTLVHMFTVTGSGSLAFPDYEGFLLHTTEIGVGIGGRFCHRTSVSYPSGIPTVTYTAQVSPTAATMIMVFAT